MDEGKVWGRCTVLLSPSGEVVMWTSYCAHGIIPTREQQYCAWGLKALFVKGQKKKIWENCSLAVLEAFPEFGPYSAMQKGCLGVSLTIVEVYIKLETAIFSSYQIHRCCVSRFQVYRGSWVIWPLTVAWRCFVTTPRVVHGGFGTIPVSKGLL